MTFGIGRGFAEVQILKESETGPISETFWYLMIKFCIPITIDMILTEGLPKLAQETAVTFNISRDCAELQILKE